MAKAIQLSKAFTSEAKSKFNLVNEMTVASTPFHISESDIKEEAAIESMLSDDLALDDLKSLKKITAEIKTIGKQGAILIGEKVCKARDILKSYRDGIFVKWLDYTFNSRSTGYNFLYYYEFYTSLPDETLKDCFKKMGLKPAYILASRQGPIEIKAEIIKDHYALSHQKIIPIIQEKLPLSYNDKRTRRVSISKSLRALNIIIDKLMKRKEDLLPIEKDEISKNIGSLQALLT